jgi:hypothetical protein
MGRPVVPHWTRLSACCLFVHPKCSRLCLLAIKIKSSTHNAVMRIQIEPNRRKTYQTNVPVPFQDKVSNSNSQAKDSNMPTQPNPDPEPNPNVTIKVGRRNHGRQPTFHMTWAMSFAVLTVSTTFPKSPEFCASSPSS